MKHFVGQFAIASTLRLLLILQWHHGGKLRLDQPVCFAIHAASNGGLMPNDAKHKQALHHDSRTDEIGRQDGGASQHCHC